jgi:hypothetical protein
MLLIYEDEAQFANPDVVKDITAKHMALVGELGTTFKTGSGLQRTPTATSVRTGAGGAKTIHDGPFAETREQLGGYYLIEVPDLDAALDIAKRVPIRGEGCIEVRPLIQH